MKRMAAGVAAIGTVLAAWAALALGDMQAKVVGVQDGDTITVYSPGRPQTRVRLVEIDAPESAQPYGQRSKQVLSTMVFGRTVRIRSEGEDRYGRTLGRVYVGEVDVNAAMVRQGAAWVYRDYNKDPSFPPLEARARRERRGLWALQADQITPPWEWRRGGGPPAANDNASLRDRVRPRRPAGRSQAGSTGQCTGKTRCAQMASCAEATFHLRQCGADRLDGDGDGVPCEAIC